LAIVRGRLFLLGRLVFEAEGRRLEADQLPGRQGRVALAHLAMARSQPVARDRLASVLWGDRPPSSQEAALSAVVSKLRGGLARVGLGEMLQTVAGCYVLRLPSDVWIDVEHAATELDRAEGALRRGEVEAAWASATVALAILRRPLLPGDDGDWVERQRTRLHGQRLRASDCLTEVWIARGEGRLAQHLAEEALEVAPLREASHRQLIQAHLVQHNRSEALLAYDRCRRLLVEELGVEPAPATLSLFEDDILSDQVTVAVN
jgi:DNA-binding SARP family transcriptional activator